MVTGSSSLAGRPIALTLSDCVTSVESEMKESGMCACVKGAETCSEQIFRGGRSAEGKVKDVGLLRIL